MSARPTAVFVTSPSLTGTTMLSLILGSLKGAFNCGEPAFLFHDAWKDLDKAWADPRQKYADRAFWADVQRQGIERFFPAIHEKTGAQIMIDCTNAEWGRFALPQHTLLDGSGIDVKDIMIWKSPLEQSYSYYRRNRDVMSWFDNRWVKRMNLFFENIDQPLLVRYRDVAKSPDTILPQICDALNMPYDPAIKEFWRVRQPCLFGNKGVIAELHEAWETGEHPRGGIVYDDGWTKLPEAIVRQVQEREDLTEWTERLEALSLNP